MLINTICVAEPVTFKILEEATYMPLIRTGSKLDFSHFAMSASCGYSRFFQGNTYSVDLRVLWDLEYNLIRTVFVFWIFEVRLHSLYIGIMSGSMAKNYSGTLFVRFDVFRTSRITVRCFIYAAGSSEIIRPVPRFNQTGITQESRGWPECMALERHLYCATNLTGGRLMIVAIVRHSVDVI